jgi:hypothetical protein
VQAARLDPSASRLALAGRAPPLGRLARVVGSGERPRSMLAARRLMVAALNGNGGAKGEDRVNVSRLAGIVDRVVVIPLGGSQVRRRDTRLNHGLPTFRKGLLAHDRAASRARARPASGSDLATLPPRTTAAGLAGYRDSAGLAAVAVDEPVLVDVGGVLDAAGGNADRRRTARVLERPLDLRSPPRGRGAVAAALRRRLRARSDRAASRFVELRFWTHPNH